MKVNPEANKKCNRICDDLKVANAEIQRLKAEWDASCQREQDRWHQQERLVQNERGNTAEIKRLQAEVERLREQNAAFSCSECGWHHAVDCDHKAEVERLKEELDWTNKGNDEFSHLTGTLAAEVKSLRAEMGGLEAWQKVAAEANIAIDEYLRTIKPDLDKEYGMPVDGVRRVIEHLREELDEQISLAAAGCSLNGELKAEVERLMGANEHLRVALNASNEEMERLEALVDSKGRIVSCLDADLRAKLTAAEKVIEAAKKVDADWDIEFCQDDEPVMMDCMGVDILKGLQTALTEYDKAKGGSI